LDKLHRICLPVPALSRRLDAVHPAGTKSRRPSPCHNHSATVGHSPTMVQQRPAGGEVAKRFPMSPSVVHA
jgi:hypothetical protein